ncbi:MAG: SOS response-associated peptidase family protein [Lachnospiraceae bacterium]|nr:SOS response-associated peptidase family protein [Lachnospiraceae bacterium]
MCCRYWLEESNELKPIVDRMMKSPLVSKWHKSYAAPIKMSGEIRPADLAPVIAMNMGGKKSVFPMKWGFTEKSLLMNARAETAAVKPAFKEAWARHRCIIPASYYFEWEHLISNDGKKHTGDKYLIQPKDSRVTWLCGLYRFENDMPVFTILTREADEGIRFIHDRMPLIMPDYLVDEWIKPVADPKLLIKESVTEMIAEKTV